MENIIQPNESFDFSTISLAHPTGIQGGAYFTKINNNGKSLYIQTPKSLTKQGFVKNGKKIYADLMFDNNDEQFINWLENLETKCQDLIFEKKDSWFDNQLDKNDIETAFTSPMRVYKSGKFYLVRVNVKVSSTTNIPSVKIYNESETPLTIDDINHETNIISILEIQGIKFTSRNFQIEIELKQSMILNNDALFENCLIKTNAKTHTHKEAEPKMELIVEHLETPIEVLEELSNHIVKNDIKLEEIKTEEPSILDPEEYDEEESVIYDDEYSETHHPPLTLGNEIKSNTTVRFKEPDINGLEEIEFDIVDEELREVDIDSQLNTLDNISNAIKLKKPNQVYYEIYKQARKKAKLAKKEAVLAFLEAKNIKKTYMLDDLDESDSDNSDLDNMEELEM